MAFEKNVMISVMHGTYGHQDDGYGALQLANAILAKGGNVTIYLRSDGVYMGIKGQDPKGLGLPNNLDELDDFIELGGVIKADRTALGERGLLPDDLVENIELIGRDKILAMLSEHDFCLTF